MYPADCQNHTIPSGLLCGTWPISPVDMWERENLNRGFEVCFGTLPRMICTSGSRIMVFGRQGQSLRSAPAHRPNDQSTRISSKHVHINFLASDVRYMGCWCAHMRETRVVMFWPARDFKSSRLVASR
jgi:hypothetical protein